MFLNDHLTYPSTRIELTLNGGGISWHSLNRQCVLIDECSAVVATPFTVVHACDSMHLRLDIGSEACCILHHFYLLVDLLADYLLWKLKFHCLMEPIPPLLL